MPPLFLSPYVILHLLPRPEGPPCPGAHLLRLAVFQLMLLTIFFSVAAALGLDAFEPLRPDRLVYARIDLQGGRLGS
ncbi:MAG: hypothetical protein ABWK01_05075 [Infirmifilum sp.]